MSDELSRAFIATLDKVTSVKAGGSKVTFDLPETEDASAADLLSKFRGKILSVAVIVNPEKTDF